MITKIKIFGPVELYNFNQFNNNKVRIAINMPNYIIKMHIPKESIIDVIVLKGELEKSGELSYYSSGTLFSKAYQNIIIDEQGNETVIDYTPRFKYRVV